MNCARLMGLGMVLAQILVPGAVHAQEGVDLPSAFRAEEPGRDGPTVWKYGVSNWVEAFALMKSGQAPQPLIEALRVEAREESKRFRRVLEESSQYGPEGSRVRRQCAEGLQKWDQISWGVIWITPLLAAAGDAHAYDQLEASMRSEWWASVEITFKVLGYIGDARAARLLGEFLFKPTPKDYDKYGTDVGGYPYDQMSVDSLRRMLTNRWDAEFWRDRPLPPKSNTDMWRAWWTTNGAAVIERLEREEAARRGAVNPPASTAVAATAALVSVPAEVARPRVWPWVLGGVAVLAALGAWWQRRGGGGGGG